MRKGMVIEREDHLADSILIRASDDKDCVSQIVATIKSNAGKGFVISGYPTQKSQFLALEKAMTNAGANLVAEQVKFLSALSARARAQLRSINGVIFALSTDFSQNRWIDPQSGSVYKPGFYVPGIADLIGVKPLVFLEARQVIEDRLEDLPLPEPPSPKIQQQFVQFEQQLRRSVPTVSVPTVDDILDLLRIVDDFLVDLFKKNPNDLPNRNPLTMLVRPKCLIRPGHCLVAVSTWRQVLEIFGRPIADQSRLVSTLPSKLDVLIRAATDRYGLHICRRDGREDLGQTCDPSQHFRAVWEASISVRNQNVDLVDDIIDRSGLIELLLELRTSAKIVFIALINRLCYVKWFRDQFADLLTDCSTEFEFFDTLDLATDFDIPTFDCKQSFPYCPLSESLSHSELPVRRRSPFRSFRKLPSFESIHGLDERRQMAEIRGVHYLLENMKTRPERPPDSIYFNPAFACQALHVSRFDPKDLTFDQTMLFAEAFLGHLSMNLSGEMLAAEIESSGLLFKKFVTLCMRKEAAMVNAVFDFRDALIRFAYAKCTHEMEVFSKRFRLSKSGAPFQEGLFEYDFDSVDGRIRPLAELLMRLPRTAIIQDFVRLETVLKLAKRCTALEIEYANGDRFMEVVRDVVADEDDQRRVELCLRVMECVECFSVKTFLLSFARTREDEVKINNIFSSTEKRQLAVARASCRSVLFTAIGSDGLVAVTKQES
jgi:hypothetical protein